MQSSGPEPGYIAIHACSTGHIASILITNKNSNSNKSNPLRHKSQRLGGKERARLKRKEWGHEKKNQKPLKLNPRSNPLRFLEQRPACGRRSS
jgi:hypothetical protein